MRARNLREDEIKTTGRHINIGAGALVTRAAAEPLKKAAGVDASINPTAIAS